MTDLISELRAENATLDSLLQQRDKQLDQMTEERDAAQEDLRATAEKLRMAQMLLGRIAEKSTDLGELLALINEAHGQLPAI